MNQKTMATALVLALVVAGMAFGTVEASGPNPTPNELCGVRNMVNDAARPHMIEAMTFHTADQGDAGMFTAVAASDCR